MQNGPKPSGEEEALPGSSVDPAELVRLQHELSEARQSLETLYAALDNVDAGLLILNQDLRAVYSNPVLHVMFRANSAEEIRKTGRSTPRCWRPPPRRSPSISTTTWRAGWRGCNPAIRIRWIWR